MLGNFRKVVAQLATGGGKTVTFAGIAHKYLAKNNPKGILPGSGKTMLILVHRIELLSQTRKTCYNAFKISCQPVTAGMKFIPPADVYVGMVETVNRILAKRGSKAFGDVGVVIIDEAHRLEFMKIHPYFPTQYIIGFSATPLTASKKKPMRLFYDEIVCGVDIPHLIADGHLCQNVTYAPKDTVDRMKLAAEKGGMIGGEFNDAVMSKEYSKVKYVHNTVSSYKKYADNTKCLIFNVNIAHSLIVTQAFVDAGYDSKHLDSNMSQHERDAVLKWFEITPNAILNNVGITTTGFDEPTIETIIINKATASMPLWLQMCGRGSRPTDAKSAFIIIDMGGNAITHGDWCQSRDWYDLFHNPGKPGKNTVAPVKCCPNCAAIIHAAARTCPICEFAYPEKSIGVEADLHDFIVVTKNINVEKVMSENKDKKENYPFFKIGRDLADNAKQTLTEMRDDYAEYIAVEYNKLAKEWLRQYNDSRPTQKRKNYNQWYQNTSKRFLFEQLAERFPDWTNPLASKNPPAKQIKMDMTIKPIETIKSMHYEM